MSLLFTDDESFTPEAEEPETASEKAIQVFVQEGYKNAFDGVIEIFEKCTTTSLSNVEEKAMNQLLSSAVKYLPSLNSQKEFKKEAARVIKLKEISAFKELCPPEVAAKKRKAAFNIH